MEIAVVIAALLEIFGPYIEKWLEDCLAPDARGVATLRRWGPLLRWRIGKGYKRAFEAKGMSSRDARNAAKAEVDALGEDIKAADDAELVVLLKDAADKFRELKAAKASSNES